MEFFCCHPGNLLFYLSLNMSHSGSNARCCHSCECTTYFHMRILKEKSWKLHCTASECIKDPLSMRVVLRRYFPYFSFRCFYVPPALCFCLFSRRVEKLFHVSFVDIKFSFLFCLLKKVCEKNSFLQNSWEIFILGR